MKSYKDSIGSEEIEDILLNDDSCDELIPDISDSDSNSDDDIPDYGQSEIQHIQINKKYIKI